MPKGKILMGKTTPKPGDSDMGLDPNRPRYIGDTKGNMYSVDPKTGKQTLVKAGPKPKPGPGFVSPGPENSRIMPYPSKSKPKPKPKPTVVNKQIPTNKPKPGPKVPPQVPVQVPGFGARKTKPVTRRGGR